MVGKWDDLTPAQRRVEIAKDVIATIHAGGWGLIQEGNYVLVLDMMPVADADNPLSKSKAREMQSRCHVCARGALLLSRVAKFNKLSWSDIQPDGETGYDDTTKGLRGAFTERQLLQIEGCFEGWGHLSEHASQWYESLPDPDDRLLAIMQNIIDHKGTFKPHVLYEVKAIRN